MIEFEWEKKAKRADVAKLLRDLAASVQAGAVEIERDGWQIKADVGTDMTVGIELEVGDDETELEIELRWPRKRA